MARKRQVQSPVDNHSHDDQAMNIAKQAVGMAKSAKQAIDAINVEVVDVQSNVSAIVNFVNTLNSNVSGMKGYTDILLDLVLELYDNADMLPKLTLREADILGLETEEYELVDDDEPNESMGHAQESLD